MKYKTKTKNMSIPPFGSKKRQSVQYNRWLKKPASEDTVCDTFIPSKSFMVEVGDIIYIGHSKLKCMVKKIMSISFSIPELIIVEHLEDNKEYEINIQETHYQLMSRPLRNKDMCKKWAKELYGELQRLTTVKVHNSVQIDIPLKYFIKQFSYIIYTNSVV